ncbi:MAG TPA: helix-turn-helix transcriptional regulator [Solirubrobacterales bacterium]|jgi:DNA-binding transcriptional ArsR family regulator|nr:helix-turn-helix transcriptional regulator [Solirubrobacterales bacterium]
MGHWLDGIADPVRLQILRSLSKVPEATASELADLSPASYRTLRRHLEALETLDVVRSHPGTSDGERSGRPATRFSLSPDVRDSVRATFARTPQRRQR